MKTFAILGSLFGMLAVVTGAFGAHGLADKVDARMLEIWQTAAHYQMVHALALFAAAWLFSQTQATAAITAGWCFTAGILVFSGSLYLMVFTGARWLGAITPIGGTAMIVGWFCCMLAALKLGS
ncbi:DUF423 domain-containing protein [Lujinxingia vulgaris]|uniref:DUF423 domain-containing protein n=1 Tax=Lujinxingia vulgaris TaxID=2600176 RepID=A0A5C6XBJ8_9DELT|nr:DUF423 domain-containing protein [Lujinxingia vulgaris]TXD34739.1 DUF423 domain-containing protein [Lujinxingia vulgaris]